ncbi:MAG: class I SAM-dependent methyltransferase [Candidatus Paceibacterota bacterium]|jgi:SAM-dependent methyltransferase
MDIGLYREFDKIGNDNWWYAGRRKIISTILHPFLIPGDLSKKRVLSVGCGTGQELDFLGRYGSVAGVDKSEEAIYFCRKNNPKSLVAVADAEKLPFPDKVFALVFILDVIEHVDNPNAVLNEIDRVLKDDGTVVLTVPAYNFLWSKSDERSHHKCRFTAGRLRDLVSQRFEVKRLTYFNTIFFPAIALIKIALGVFEPKGLSQYEVSNPPKLLNEILKKVFLSEAFLLRYFRLPFGVSIGTVLVKKR